MYKILQNRFFYLSCFLIILVVISQYTQLQLAIERGYPGDDWGNWLTFKFISGSFIDKIIQNWLIAGPQFQSFGLYPGIMEAIFREKHYLINIASIVLKTLATISIFPTIYIISKNKLLAFLTTILYAISHSSAGGLAIMVNGGEYLGIFLMNLSLIFYYLSVKKFHFFNFLPAVLALFLAFVIAPNRVYPISFILVLVEIFLIFRRKTRLMFSLLRIFTVISPVVLIVLFSPKHINYGLQVKGDTLQLILNGNWHLLLTNTLSGIGYMMVNSEFIKQANISLSVFESLGSYMSFLVSKIFWFLMLTSAVLSVFLSKKPVRFFITVLGINLIFDVLNYFISSHFLFLPSNLRLEPDQYFFTAQVVLPIAFFAISLAIGLLLEYILEKEKKTILLLPFFSLAFSIIFLYSPWVIAGRYYTLWPVHRYLTVPQLGVSLFLASLLVIAFGRISRQLRLYFILFIIPALLFFNYFQSKQEIDSFFYQYIISGGNITAEAVVQRKLLDKIPKSKLRENVAIYISPEANSPQSQYWLTALSLVNVEHWLSLRKSYLYDTKQLDGCIVAVYDIKFLEEKALLKDKTGFVMRGKCFDQKEKPILIDKEEVFFPVDNFYAFKMKETELTDIRDDILRQLRMN
ncbi:hypothetical protein HYU45_02690 [Candidatus Daviesbacteria bacterium]|nr:hypothetical protein [Candidatus Daviesbacteria bacterium]